MTALLALVFAGCAWVRDIPYEERYEIKHLTVILMDEASIRAKWEDMSRKPGVRIVAVGPEPTVQVDTVRGFFDFNTNTIYCPKAKYDVCGHELFHAIFGQFHPEP